MFPRSASKVLDARTLGLHSPGQCGVALLALSRTFGVYLRSSLVETTTVRRQWVQMKANNIEGRILKDSGCISRLNSLDLIRQLFCSCIQHILITRYLRYLSSQRDGVGELKIGTKNRVGTRHRLDCIIIFTPPLATITQNMHPESTDDKATRFGFRNGISSTLGLLTVSLLLLFLWTCFLAFP